MKYESQEYWQRKVIDLETRAERARQETINWMKGHDRQQEKAKRYRAERDEARARAERAEAALAESGRVRDENMRLAMSRGATLARVRELYRKEVECTAYCSDDLEAFLAELSEALEGEDA